MQVRQLMNEATIAAANQQSARDAWQAGQREAGDQRLHELQMQRERLGYDGEQRGLDRAHQYGMTGYEYGLRNEMADNDAFREDWLSGNNFNREFYGQMSTLAAAARFNSARDFSGLLAQYALENPDIFSPQDYGRALEVIGGSQDSFLTQIFNDMFGGF
jgi:hypothetical protein